MSAAPDESGEPTQPNPVPLGLFVAGALVFGRHALLVGAAHDRELAPWLLAQSLPERLIEALILGVVASALAHRLRGGVPFTFNAAVLAWGAAGIPRPDVGAALPLALLLGVGLAGAVSLGSALRPRLLSGPAGIALGGLVGLGLPLLSLSRAAPPTWTVSAPVETWPATAPHTSLTFIAPEGGPYELRAVAVARGGLHEASFQVHVAGAPRGVRPSAADPRIAVPVPGGAEVRIEAEGGGLEAVALTQRVERHPRVARPDAPSLVLVVLDGVGFARADPATAPALAGLARQGTSFTRAVAAAGTRAAAAASLLGGERLAPPAPEPRTTLAEVLALEGFATALFGAPRLARASRHGAGFQVVRLDAAGPEAAVERAALWTHGVAGARFFLVVHLPTDAPSPADVDRARGDAGAAGLRAADRALGLLRAHLENLGVEETTVLAVVGTIEEVGTRPDSLRQLRLHVPLVISGPGVSAGREVAPAVEARAIAPTLAARAGLPARAGLDLLDTPADRALFLGPSGARGVRQGDWTLWLDAGGRARVFQVVSDPGETSDVAPERQDRVQALRELLDP